MAANIQFLRSTVPYLRPNPIDLSLGTPMVNVNETDPGLFFRTADGGLIKIGPTHVGFDPPNLIPPSGANPALCVGEQWLDVSDHSRPKHFVWDGASWLEPTNTGLVYVQDAEPKATSVVDNAFWFKPTTRELLLRHNDTWIDIQRAPYGNQGEIQYNDGDEFHASSKFKYDETLNQLTLGSILFPDGKIFDGVHGSQDQIQYNLNNEFSSSPEFTYSPAGKLFTVLGSAIIGNAAALPPHTISLNGTLGVNGDTTIDGNVQLGVNSSQTLTIKSTVTLETDLVINTNLTCNNLTCNNDATVGSSDGDIFTSNGISRLNGRVEIGLDASRHLIIKSESFFEGDVELATGATLSQWYIEKLSNVQITSPQIGQILVHGPGNKWYNEAPGAGPYGNVVEEAPLDGQKYVRQNGAWVVA